MSIDDVPRRTNIYFFLDKKRIECRKMKYVISVILIMLTHCSPQSALNHQCNEFALLYQNHAERQQSSDKQMFSLESIKPKNRIIINNIVTNWPQSKLNIQNFSNDLFLFLRTRIYLQCNDTFSKNTQSTAFTTDITTGIQKEVTKPSEFMECILNKWVAAVDLTERLCKVHFSF